MDKKIPEQLAVILQSTGTVKLLITTDEQGVPHAVVKSSLQLDDANNLVYFEFLESSQTNKNMVRSIWFDRTVSVTVVGENSESYQIKGRPIKAIVSGQVFRKYYQQVQQGNSENDLAAVWLIEPQQIIEQSLPVRQRQETENRPYFKHLDRLAKY